MSLTKLRVDPHIILTVIRLIDDMKTKVAMIKSRKWALVDDDPAVLEVMRFMLASMTRSELVAFNDPSDAIAAIRSQPDEFEMLITDRNMPQMDGVGLLVLARVVAPHLKFLMVTGNIYGLDEELDRFDLPHCYVAKPLRVDAFAAAIESASHFVEHLPVSEHHAGEKFDVRVSKSSVPIPGVTRYLRMAVVGLSFLAAIGLQAHDDAESSVGRDHDKAFDIAQATRSMNQVSITVEGGFRVISANGIPNHSIGRFPNNGNPNVISAQQHSFRIPAKPKVANRPTQSGPAFFGVAINGVPFEAGTAEFWNRDRRSGWNYEALSGHINLGVDQNNAHVQPTGAYHYHSNPTGLAKLLKDDGSRMVLVGWAADGFPIYTAYGLSDPMSPSSRVKKMTSSYQLKTGVRSGGPGGRYDGRFTEDYEYQKGTGDLDECNGRFGVTPEFPAGIYHYYITEEFPYISRQWKGTPDQSFMKRGGGGGRRGAPQRGGRPPRGA